MPPLGKALKTATLTPCFLLQYRTTSHCTTGVPPSELLFNKVVVKRKIPVMNKKKVVNRHLEARNKEIKCKEHNREYADQRRNTRKSDVKIADKRAC